MHRAGAKIPGPLISSSNTGGLTMFRLSSGLISQHLSLKRGVGGGAHIAVDQPEQAVGHVHDAQRRVQRGRGLGGHHLGHRGQGAGVEGQQDGIREETPA